MKASLWEVGKAAQAWPVMGLLDHRFRKLPIKSRGDQDDGLLVVHGILRRDGNLLAIEDIRLQPEFALLLLDQVELEGAEVVVLGRMQSIADARGDFSSYRASPSLRMLTEGCVMGAAAWEYFRAGPFSRGFYRLAGALVGLRETLRGGFCDRRRAAAAICVGCLAAGVMAMTAIYLHSSKRQMATTWRTMRQPLPPAAQAQHRIDAQEATRVVLSAVNSRGKRGASPAK